MSHIFTLKEDHFQRRMDPLDSWKEQFIFYLKKRYNKTREEAIAIITEAAKRKGMNDPQVEYYQKDLNTMDKKKTRMNLSQYLSTIKSGSMTIAPSFTCYTTIDADGLPWVSMHSKMMSSNKEMRSYHKSLAKKAAIAKDFVMFDIQDTIQTSKKMGNNAYSGAACQLHMPFATHSSHYTFTSTTRVVTSTANVLSESIIAGYRLYFTPDDVRNEWVAIMKYHDSTIVEKAISKYGLVYPTVDDLMNMVRYNIYYFWDNEQEFIKIRQFAETLTPLDRACIMYRLDLYHLLKLNKQVVETLLTDVSSKQTGLTSDLRLLDDAPEYKLNMLYYVLSDDMAGKGLDHNKFAGTPTADLLASTMHGINVGFDNMSLLIDAFFKTEVMPINIAHYKKAVRRAIALSDTDSTVGIYAPLVEQRFGHSNLTSETIGYMSAIATILSETVVNALLLLSVNMNVPKSKIRELNMKSEFFFPFLGITNQSKHYIDLTMIQEMVVKLNEKVKFHGVSLISGNIDDKYNEYKQALAEMISEATTKGHLLNPMAILQDVIKLENDIKDKVYNLDNSVLSYADVKNKDAYSVEAHRSAYFHFILWEEVFAPKYGHTQEPPYVSVRIPLITDTSKRLADFVNAIEDEGVRARYAATLKKYNKKTLGTIQLPLAVVSDNGVPDELVGAIDTKRIVLAQTASIRIVMDLIGIPTKDGILIGDTYSV